MMTARAFRNLLADRPVEPFRVSLIDGRRFDVLKPNHAFITHSELIVGVDIDETDFPENFKICALQNISAVESISIQQN
jgi:hypothetical protein